jgi:hypothetical protein
MISSDNLSYALAGLATGGILGVWGGSYLGRIWEKMEAYVAKEKNAAEADAAHMSALFREVKVLYQEFDAKAKADAAAVKADASKVIETVEKI